MINNFETISKEWLETKRLSVKYSSYLKYENIIIKQINPYFHDINLEDIDDNIVIKFFSLKMNEENLSNSYLRTIKYVLSSVCELAKETIHSINIHWKKIKIPKSNKTLNVLNDENRDYLIQYCKENTNSLSTGILLSLFSGMRIGEVCALKWKNVDLKTNIITVETTVQRLKTKEENISAKTSLMICNPKTKTSHRLIPIPLFLSDYLQHFKKTDNDENFVLSNSEQIFDPRRLQIQFKNLCQNNGFSTNFHNLRHSFATECVMENIEIKSLSEILGHSSVSITLDIYVHSSMEHKRKEMMKMKTPLQFAE